MLASYLLALSFLTFALAAPQTPDADWSVHIPLVKRKPLSVKDLPRAVAALKAKYRITSPSVPSKRAGNTAAIPIVDEVRLTSWHHTSAAITFSQQNDSSYSGEVTIGTPCAFLALVRRRALIPFNRPQTFQAILDTGKSTLYVWIIFLTWCLQAQPIFGSSQIHVNPHNVLTSLAMTLPSLRLSNYHPAHYKLTMDLALWWALLPLILFHLVVSPFPVKRGVCIPP